LEAARLSLLTRLRRVAADLKDLLAAPESASSEWVRAAIQQRYLMPLGL